MTNLIGNKILNFDQLDSTSDEARRLIKKGVTEGLVICALEQTKGRGKPGSSWFSVSGLGLYLSVVLKPYKNPNDLSPLTLLVAKVIVQVVKDLTGLSSEIKLPNDVFLNGKKVCGILLERVASGELIIGIGVNLDHDQADFPQELKNTATSLKIETGQKVDRMDFMTLLLSCLDQAYLAYLK